MLNHVIKTAEDNPESVLSAFDNYCSKNGHLMIVGRSKGKILEEEIRAANPKKVLELGSFYGYSAVLLAKELKEDARFVSIEIEPLHAAITNQVLRKAGLDGKAKALIGTLDGLKSKLKTEFDNFDFIFIDHCKEEYLNDFQILEREGFIHEGTVICADNVIFPGAPDYLKYVKDNYDTKVREGRIEEMNLVDAVAVSRMKEKRNDSLFEKRNQ